MVVWVVENSETPLQSVALDFVEGQGCGGEGDPTLHRRHDPPQNTHIGLSLRYSLSITALPIWYTDVCGLRKIKSGLSNFTDGFTCVWFKKKDVGLALITKPFSRWFNKNNRF
ncbi:hypothetical protein HanIR_Chr11g0510731 [Helianthus annuus]|nr:hypothetical protein HanIR_Chr11g0510731 [Helianthus annuus]